MRATVESSCLLVYTPEIDHLVARHRAITLRFTVNGVSREGSLVVPLSFLSFRDSINDHRKRKVYRRLRSSYLDEAVIVATMLLNDVIHFAH